MEPETEPEPGTEPPAYGESSGSDMGDAGEIGALGALPVELPRRPQHVTSDNTSPAAR